MGAYIYASAPGLSWPVYRALHYYTGLMGGNAFFWLLAEEVYAKSLTLQIRVHRDPSACFRLEVTNPPGSQYEAAWFNVSVPVEAFGANNLSMQLDVDLVDSDGNGSASMLRGSGYDAMLRHYVYSDAAPSWVPHDLGLTDLTEPGTYSFELGPLAGDTLEADGKMEVISAFRLSVGDTALLRAKMVRDDGSGVPACEVPGLPFVTGCSDPDAILGTDDDDDLEGTPGDDIICGGAGNDRIDGKGGNDRIFGGSGRDVLSGGPGRDLIYGEEGKDIICGDDFAGQPGGSVGKVASACVSSASAAASKDTIFGGAGNDAIGGGPGADVIHGEDGKDKLAGGPGDDRLYGEDGKDRLAGGDDDDRIDGGPGADRLAGDDGNDKLLARDGVADSKVDGGDGNDSAQIDGAEAAALTSVETLLP